MLTAWIAANVYAYVHGHTAYDNLSLINFKISRRDSWSTTHRGWTTTHENQLLNALNFMTSTDAIAAKNAFVLITGVSWSKQMRSLRRLRPCTVMKIVQSTMGNRALACENLPSWSESCCLLCIQNVCVTVITASQHAWLLVHTCSLGSSAGMIP